MIDERQTAATRRMEMRRPEEVILQHEGQNNDHPNQRAEYPRMLYRKTETPQHQEWADTLHAGSEEKMVVNSFDGLLCDTTTANDVDEAEQLAEDGWDISPRAAHGMATGIVAATTAKDDEIAELRRQLSEAHGNQSGSEDAEVALRRGPGRPRASG